MSDHLTIAVELRRIAADAVALAQRIERLADHIEGYSPGAEVRALRQQLGLSQADFGARLGVGQNVVSRWEVGARIPSPENLARIRALAAEVGA